MTSTDPHLRQYRRILRRETHSSRAGVAILLAAILAIVVAWVGIESVFEFLGRDALLVAPTAAITELAQLPDAVTPAGLIGAGVVTAILGLVLVLLALLPGRRARHTGEVGRTALVVDNTVIASALARSASSRANIDPDQVRVSVGRRVAEVTVRPTSGYRVDKVAIEQAVQGQLTELNLHPRLRAIITIEKTGVVGA